MQWLLETNAIQAPWVNRRTVVVEFHMSSQSIASNTSTIHWTLRAGSCIHGRGGFIKGQDFYLNVNGTRRFTWTGGRIDVTDGRVFGQGSFTVTHNATGDHTLTYDIGGQYYVTSGINASASGSRALTRIPRFTSLTARTHTNLSSAGFTVNFNTEHAINQFIIHSDGSAAGAGTQWFNSGEGLNQSSGSYTFSGMGENTTRTYFISVRRRDSGLINVHGPFSQTTPWIVHTAGTSFSSATLTSINVNWSSSIAANQVEVIMGGAVVHTQTVSGTSGTVTVANRVPSTSYSTQVRTRRTGNDALATSGAVNMLTLRHPSIATFPNSFNIGSAVTLTKADHSTSDSVIHVQMRDEAGNWVTTETVNSPASQSATTFTINTSHAYARSINRNSVPMRICLRSTIAGVNYDIWTADFTGHVVNSNPTIQTTAFTLLANANNTTWNTNLGSPNTPSNIQSIGQLRVQLVANMATGLNQAVLRTISHRVVNASGVQTQTATKTYDAEAHNWDFGVGTFAPGDYTIFIRVIDSRGNATPERSVAFTVLLYANPTLAVSLERANKFEQFMKLWFTASQSRLLVGGTQRNNMTILRYRFAIAGQALPSGWTALTSVTATAVGDTQTHTRNVPASGEATSSNHFIELPSANSYTVEFQVGDTVGQTTTRTIHVAQGTPIVGMWDNGSMSVNRVPDLTPDAPALQVDGSIMANVPDGTSALRLFTDGVEQAIVRAVADGRLVIAGRNGTHKDGMYLRPRGHVTDNGQVIISRDGEIVLDSHSTTLQEAWNKIRFKQTGQPSVLLHYNAGSFHFLCTNANAPDGSYNTLRPLQFNATTGHVNMSHNLAVSGTLTTAAANLNGNESRAVTHGTGDNSTRIATTAFVKSQFGVNVGPNQMFGPDLSANGIRWFFGMDSNGWSGPGHFTLASTQNTINSWDGGVEIPNGNCRIRIGRFVIIIQSWQASVAMGVAWASASPGAAGAISTSTLGGGALGLTFASRPAFWLFGETPNTDHILVQAQGTTTNWPTFRIGQHGAQGTFTCRVNMIAIGRDR